MQNHYRKEIPVPVDGLPGHFEWWEVGIDFDDGPIGHYLEFFPGFPVDETETDAFGHPVTDQASS